MILLNSIQFSSVTQSSPTLCDPMNCRTPALPVHHQLPEFTQTHDHRVGDPIQPSHPLSSSFPPAPNPSQHQVSLGEVTQSCLTLCDPVDCDLLGFSVHGILEARILEWIAISFPRGSSQPRDQTQVSRIGGRRFNLWATRETSIRVFSNESTLHMRWPKYWSFSFSISPSEEHPGLISFRMNWLDLLAVQGTLKSLLQHHSSKASIFLR